MRPEINTVAAQVYSPSALTDVTDNPSIDFQGLANAVSAAAARFRPNNNGSEQGMMKQIWNDLLDDVLGPKNTNGAMPAH